MCDIPIYHKLKASHPADTTFISPINAQINSFYYLQEMERITMSS